MGCLALINLAALAKLTEEQLQNPNALDSQGNQPLLVALENSLKDNNLKDLEDIIKRGADVNLLFDSMMGEITLLHTVANKFDKTADNAFLLEIMQFLLKNGANPNIGLESAFDESPLDGFTPFHMAYINESFPEDGFKIFFDKNNVIEVDPFALAGNNRPIFEIEEYKEEVTQDNRIKVINELAFKRDLLRALASIEVNDVGLKINVDQKIIDRFYKEFGLNYYQQQKPQDFIETLVQLYFLEKPINNKVANSFLTLTKSWDSKTKIKKINIQEISNYLSVNDSKKIQNNQQNIAKNDKKDLNLLCDTYAKSLNNNYKKIADYIRNRMELFDAFQQKFSPEIIKQIGEYKGFE